MQKTTWFDQIAICQCGYPLTWTFMFAGAEYYCLNCGSQSGMLEAKRTERSFSLYKKWRSMRIKWGMIQKDLLPTSNFTRTDCDKCNENPSGSHWHHVTDKELEADKKARSLLSKFKNHGNHED